jgi:hypothetical protein
MRTILSLVALALLTACATPPRPFSASSIHIRKISPPIAQTLKAGQNVTFVVEVDYVLEEDSGSVGLFVQKNLNFEKIAGTKVQVPGGNGTVTLQVDVPIPVAPTIYVFTPLYGKSGGRTIVLDTRTFEVTP